MSKSKQVLQDYERSLARVILLCIDETPLSLGMGKIIGILKGGKSTFFVDRNLHQLSTYGVLPSFSREYLEAVISVLLEQGLTAIEMVSEYENLPVLKLTQKGKDFLAGTLDIEIPFVDKLADKSVIELNEQERVLFDALRQVRLKIAVAKGLPAYTICHDAILREMARMKPTSSEELLSMRGIGQKFVQNYGNFFLEAVVQNISNKPA